MASSPSCSSISPAASTTTTSADLQETDAFSDDSGVDVKPQQSNKPRYDANMAVESRRNKRKSSEPKKRKEVLQMKRFRWDTDEEDLDRDNEDLDDVKDDVFDVIERERPSSGDSGCQMDAPVTPLSNHVEKKKRPRQWRKPKVDKTVSSVLKTDSNDIPAFRQSVIRKHDASSTSALVHHNAQLPNAKLSNAQLSNFPKSTSVDDPTTSGALQSSTADYGDIVLDSQDDSNGPSNSRTGMDSRPAGRPRNYKSMSRQRRIEANARERTRVHTISAAFENLRRAVPAYAHNQKLSKLAILRIASAYIVALACLNQQDYSQEQSQPSLADCVEQCTRTIQAEGRSRRRTSKD